MYQHARAIGDNNRRDFHPQVKNQQAIDDSSHRDFCQLAKSQQAIDGFAVELSQTTVCEIFALAKTDRPAGRFNRRQQSASYAATAAFYRPAGRFNRL